MEEANINQPSDDRERLGRAFVELAGTLVASSNEDAELMELLQLQNDQGPCLDCYRKAAPISVADLSQERARWPLFVDAVTQRGPFRAVHALPLRLRGQAIGALNLFSTHPGPLPGTELALGQALADVATIGILHEQAIRRAETLSEQLQTALNSRLVIEQAKGLLKQHSALSLDSAFDRLRRYARSHNLRLSQVARDIIEGRLAPSVMTSTQ